MQQRCASGYSTLDAAVIRALLRLQGMILEKNFTRFYYRPAPICCGKFRIHVL